MSFERSYSIESHERIKQILIFADKSLLLLWWVTYKTNSSVVCNATEQNQLCIYIEAGQVKNSRVYVYKFMYCLNTFF